MLIPSIHERKTWLGFILAVLIGLNLYFNFSFDGALEERSSRIDQFFGRALLPAQWLIGLSKEAVLDSSTSLRDLAAAKEDNISLRKELTENRLRLLELERLQSENNRLRALLDFEELKKRNYLAARVQGKDPSLFFKSLVINRGARHGLVEKLPVVNLQGVVGQILEVGPFQSTVLLITDLNSRVDAVVSRSRSRVIVAGASDDGLQLRFLPRRQDLRAGDLLVSSGLDGIYPPGFPIGEVTELNSRSDIVLDSAKVRPKVDFNAIEEVFVILPSSPKIGQTEDQDS